jgi:outer membrane protein assembly factor BamD (BamD/ComL family)
MLRTPRLLSAICAAALLLPVGCASLHLPSPSWMGDKSAPPGTKPWWTANKKKSVFDPGKGYRVEGTPGYFDQQGRPVNARVAKVVGQKSKDHGGLLGDVGFKEKVNGLKESVGLGPDQKQAQADFDAAENEFRAEKYSKAAKLYKKAAAGWPESQLEQDAMFMLAESYFFDNNYSKASNAYEALIRKYTNSTHLDKCITRQFAIARFWEQYEQYKPHWVLTPNLFDNTRPLFDTIGRSMKNYDNIRIDDPTGPLADDAIMAMGNSYFVRGRYYDSDEQYELLRKEYPRSDHQFEAHILGLQSKLRKYQGASYDDTPLREAKLLAKQLKIQFAGKMKPDQREEIVEIEARLNKELANREFNMAKHYDDLDEYGAAKFYYVEVLKHYPQTPLAEESRTRLAAIGGLPDRPTSSLDPVLNLLPENAERRAIAQVPPVPDSDTRLAEQPQDGGADGGSTVRR